MAEATAAEATRDALAVTVHGPVGVIDLLVPAGAKAFDLARAYASEAGIDAIPLMQRPDGTVLPPDRTLRAAGVTAGSILVAATGLGRPRRSRLMDQVRRIPPSPGLAAFMASVAVGLAVVGTVAASGADTQVRAWVLSTLGVIAIFACVPWGRHQASRAAAAPAFAGLGVGAALWQPGEFDQTGVIAASALAAAAVAAVARTFVDDVEEPARVWIIVGLTVAAVTSVAPLTGWPVQVSWAALLLVAVFSARLAPALAVQVPDEVLLDLDRLAVTAWSARDVAAGPRRSRVVVAPDAMTALVASASRTVLSSAVAVAVVATLSSQLLLAHAELELDRVGARVLVFLAGACLLLVARSHRHRGARLLLRLGGFGAWLSLAIHALSHDLVPAPWMFAAGAVAVGVAVLAAAVATGRGWRSAWWSRRAEVAESLCGAFAVAAAVVASGFFRVLWEITS